MRKNNFLNILLRNIPVLIALFSIITGLLILGAFISRLEITCNDDVYVYFTYARNFIQGRFFAYDPRNIPSEGFTSIIYLLMLIPFELIGVNMMFASALLSMAGFILTAVLALILLYRNKYLKKTDAFLLMPVLLALLLLNANALKQAGWGFDTAWGFLFSLAAITFLCEMLKPVSDKSRLKSNWVVFFYLSLFLSLLCRPENFIYAGLMCLYGFWYYPEKKIYYIGFGGFATILFSFVIWKYLFFKDIFPTAFYRKMGVFDKDLFPGLSYLLSFFQSAKMTICFVILGLLIYLFYLHNQGGFRRSVRNNHALLLLMLCGIVNALIVTKISPLVGFGFRFLFTLQCVLAILLGWLIIRLSVLIISLISKWFPLLSRLVYLSYIVSLLFVVSLRAIPHGHYNESLFKRLDLLKRADIAVEHHHYVRFGRFLRDKLPDYKNITLGFGDAGAIPYEFGCRFIDTNGLTEPFIARLFLEKNPDVRAEKYAGYILEQKPDIIVLNIGSLEGGISIIRPNYHSPFGSEMNLSIWEAYRDYGFRYLVSLPMYYDLHIGVNPRSQHIAEITTALDAFAKSNNGYRNPGGLTVSLGKQQVHFDLYDKLESSNTI